MIGKIKIVPSTDLKQQQPGYFLFFNFHSWCFFPRTAFYSVGGKVTGDSTFMKRNIEKKKRCGKHCFEQYLAIRRFKSLCDPFVTNSKNKKNIDSFILLSL